MLEVWTTRLFIWLVWGIFFVYGGLLLLVVVACFVYAGAGNLWAALASDELRFATRLSVLTATLSTFLSLFFGIPCAYALTHLRGRVKAVVDTFLDLTLVLPPVAVGVALLVLFSQFPTPDRSLDRWLQRIGMPVIFEVPGIVIAQFAVISAYALRVLKAAFESANPRLPMVARTLGLSRWQIFCWVELPQIAPSLIATTILLWARAMGEFGATAVLAGATPFKTEVLPIAIWLALNRAEVDKALAAAFVLLSVSLLALFAFRQLAQRFAQ